MLVREENTKAISDEEFEQMLARMRECGNRFEEAIKNDEPPKPKPVMCLMGWLDEERVGPSVVFRSSLFGMVERGKRRFLNNERLASWSGTSVHFKGEQLDQYDLDVWLQALHLARKQNLNAENGLRFSARGFLRSIGRKYSGDAAQTLFESFTRMRACAVTVRSGSMDYMGGFVDSCARDHETGEYVLRFNPAMRAMFEAGYTKISGEKRQEIATDLGRWLYGYIESHKATTKKPHRISIEALKAISGSTEELRKFRARLKASMLTLQSLGIVLSWTITASDVLEFGRPRKLRSSVSGNVGLGKKDRGK